MTNPRPVAARDYEAEAARYAELLDYELNKLGFAGRPGDNGPRWVAYVGSTHEVRVSARDAWAKDYAVSLLTTHGVEVWSSTFVNAPIGLVVSAVAYALSDVL